METHFQSSHHKNFFVSNPLNMARNSYFPIFVAWFCFTSQISANVPEENLFPFGTSVGDIQLQPRNAYSRGALASEYSTSSSSEFAIESTATSSESWTESTSEPPSSSPSPPPSICNGHGTCHCDFGYTGASCSEEVDWCQQPTSEMGSHPKVQDICGNRGTCTSTPAGASCICFTGFTGQFCETLIPDKLWLSKRCLAYNSTTSSHTLWTPAPVGCSGYEECVPDDLQCLLTPCDHPVGWCLPNERLTPGTSSTMWPTSSKWDFTTSPFFQSSTYSYYDQPFSDSSSCSNHGQCQCDSGYTGSNCESEVDWCNQPVQGFEEPGLIKQICGNGTCITHPSGATCICEPGFIGEFCSEIDPSEAYVSLRCYAYAYESASNADATDPTAYTMDHTWSTDPTWPTDPTPYTPTWSSEPTPSTMNPTWPTVTPTGIPIGCRNGNVCVPDNLQCLLAHCKNPIGWCLPLYEPDVQKFKKILEKLVSS